MRILFVSQRAHPSVGGIESLQWAVATGLARRHEVTILAERIDAVASGRLDGVLRSPPPFDAVAENGVTVRQLRLTPAQRLLNAPLAVNVTPGLRRFAYGPLRRSTARWYAWASSTAGRLDAEVRRNDVIHVWGGDYLAVAAVRASHAQGRAAIVTPFAHPGQWGDDAGSALAYRAADAVVGLLHADARVYRELGVAEDRLRVVGVCAAPATESAIDVRARHAIAGPLALFLGVRREHKGFDRFLASARHLARLVPDATLACVGPGRPVNSDGGPLRVVDAGQVSDAERAAWLRAADLLVLPSEGEIFPVSILEAFSVGTPVVTSELATLTELVEASGGGWTASREPSQLAAAVATALADPQERARRGELGRAFWRRRHTVDAVVDQYESLYEEMHDLRRSSCA